MSSKTFLHLEPDMVKGKPANLSSIALGNTFVIRHDHELDQLFD